MMMYQQPAAASGASGGASINMCPECSIVTMLARCSNCGSITVPIRRSANAPPPPPPPPSQFQQQHQYGMSPSASSHHLHHLQSQATTPYAYGQAMMMAGDMSAMAMPPPQRSAQLPPPPPPTLQTQPAPPQQRSSSAEVQQLRDTVENLLRWQQQQQQQQQHQPPHHSKAVSPGATVNAAPSAHGSPVNTSLRAAAPSASAEFPAAMISDFEEFPYRLEAELGRLRQNQEHVEQKLSDAHRQKAVSEARLADTEQELAAARKQLRAAQDEARAAREEQARATKRLEAEQEKLRAKTEEAFRLQGEVADLTGQSDLANIEHRAAEEEMANLRKRAQEDARRAETLRARLQAEVDSVRGELAATEQRCEQRLDEQAKRFVTDAAERAELVKKLKQFEQDTHSIRAEFEADLRAEKARGEKAVLEARDESRRLSEEIATVRHRNAALDEQLSSTRRDAQAADDALRELRKKHSDMSAEFIMLRAEFDTRISEELATQADQLNTERREMKRAMDDARSREAAAADRAERLERDVQELREKVKLAQTDARDARGKAEEAERKLGEEQRLHEDGRAHAKKMQDMLNGELSRAQERGKQLDEELAATKRALGDQVQALTAERDRLARENTEFRNFTVSRELEQELRAKLAATERERNDAVATRDEAVAVVDSLKRDRAAARAKQEEAEVSSDSALQSLRELAALFDLPGASVLSLDSCQKNLVPRVREAAAVAAQAAERDRKHKDTVDGLRHELDRLSEECHKHRCDAEAERAAARKASEACEQGVAAVELKVRELRRQLEAEREVARDDIDSLGRNHEAAIAHLRAERDRLAQEAKNALLEVESGKRATAALAKEHDAALRERDDIAAERAALRRDHEAARRELDTTRDALAAAKRRVDDLEDGNARMVKQHAAAQAEREQQATQLTDMDAHYQREIESLKTALRNERSKFLREIDFTHAADARAFTAQRQLDVLQTGRPTPRQQHVVAAAYEAENLAPDTSFGSAHATMTTYSAQRGQGLGHHSPSATWNRTTIVSNPPVVKHHQHFQSPGADTPPPSVRASMQPHSRLAAAPPPPQLRHLGVSLSPDPVQAGGSAADRVAEEAAQWRETRIQQPSGLGPGGAFVHGSESSPNSAAVGRASPVVSSRSVPLGAFRRK